MPSFNLWTGIGHLVRDIKTRTLPGGAVVGDSGIACNHKYKTASGEAREEVLFLDFSIFGKGAEIMAQYAQKGDPIFLTGRLRLETWDDKTTGDKRNKIKLMVDQFQFLKGRDNAGDETDQRPQSRAPMRDTIRERSSASAGKTPADAFSGNGPEFYDEEIPFAWEGRQGQSM